MIRTPPRRHGFGTLVGTLIVVVVLLGSSVFAAAYSQYTIHMSPFAVWQPNYAACGTGFIVTDAHNTVAHGQSATWSYQHGCDMTPSPANAGTFAAQAQFHKSGGGGTYAICAQTLVGTNSQGAWVKAVDGFFDPCGSGTYRIQARWRMTYGGTNWHGAANTPYYYMVD